MTRLLLRVSSVGLVLLTACSGGTSASKPTSSASQPAASTESASGSQATSSGSASSTSSGPPATDISGDPVLDANGNIDADVVVQASDAKKFDKAEYEGKADLTMGLFNQGATHHTLLIDGRGDFRLDVYNHGDGVVADIKLDHGSYTIYCEIHRADGMEATLIIP